MISIMFKGKLSNFYIIGLLIFSILVFSSGCSLQKVVTGNISRLFSVQGDGALAFTGEDDPELVGEALPFILKMLEALLQSSPKDEELLLTTGKTFALYAYAFVQLPASQLPDEQFDKKLFMTMRTKKLFLRAKQYILRALDQRYPNFSDFLKAENWEDIIAKTQKKDVPYLYWAGLSSMGAFTADSFDVELMITLPRIIKLIFRVYELDEEYDNGGVHEVLISYYGSMPKELGGDEKKARAHYQKAIDRVGKIKASPYVALASSVSVNTQNKAEFKSLLTKALTVDIDAAPEYRLANILAQRRAKWLLDHVEDYFLTGDN
jgi:predicted anti-sigma-YlaC factor YlaD